MRLRRRHRLGLGGLGRRLLPGHRPGQILDQGVQELLGDADHVLAGVLVDHVVEQILLVAHQGEHLLLVGIRGHHGDDLYRARLAETVDAGVALFEHGRVPGHVQVDEHRPALQVEPDPAGIGGQEHLHRVVLAEPVHQLAAFGGGHPAVQAHAAQAQARDPGLGHLCHPLPLGEDHRLEPGLQADLAEDVGQFIELGRAPGLLVHQAGGVAGHARLLQGREQPVLLARGQRPAAGDLRQAAGRVHGRVVQLALFGRQDHVQPLDDPLGQLFAHQAPVAAQHHRRQPLAQYAQVTVAEHLAALVGDVEVHQVAPQGPQHPRVDHLHEAVQVLQPVFQRRAGEHEGVAAGDALDRAGDPGAPVLDALGLVHDHQVRAQGLVEHRQVAQDEFVVDDVAGGLAPVLDTPLRRRSLDDLRGQPGEPLDLPRPLVLERGRADDQHPPHPLVLAQPGGRGDGLQGLAQAHVVGQQGPAGAGEKGHALDLVGIEGGPHPGQAAVGGQDPAPDVVGAQPVGGPGGQVAGIIQGIVAQVEVGALLDQFGEAEKVLRQTAAEPAGAVEIPGEQRLQLGCQRGGAVQADLRSLVHVPGQRHVADRRRQLNDFVVVPALGDLVQHRLDVLAGAELVDLEVRAGAEVGAPLEAADGDPVAPGERVVRADGLGLPPAEPGRAVHVLDRHLGAAAFDSLADGRVRGRVELAARLPLLGIGKERGHHVGADRLAVGAVAGTLQGLLGHAHLDRAGHLPVRVLDLGPEQPLVLVHREHPMLLEGAQPFRDRGGGGHGRQSFVVKAKRVFLLRDDSALHGLTPGRSGWCQWVGAGE